MNTDLSPKTVWISIGVVILVLGITYYKLDPDLQAFNNPPEFSDGPNLVTGELIGNCRNCILLSDTIIPHTDDIGEYIDINLAKKLKKLTKLNKTWRLTEAYPPTVKHLNFCHQNGTCSDLGLYPEDRSAKNLDALCTDALKAGLVIINEYSDPKLLSGNSTCPTSNVFETTTGGHLHVQ